MAILSKACKPDNFESYNSLNLSFMNIWDLRLNFVDWEYFLESNSLDILALCETNLNDSIDFGNFSVKGYLPLIRKDSSAHVYCLTVYLREGLPLARDLSPENSADSYLFSLNSFTSHNFLLPSHLSITLFVFVHAFWFYFILGEVISIKPSANVFTFRDFNVHHKELPITYSAYYLT